MLKTKINNAGTANVIIKSKIFVPWWYFSPNSVISQKVNVRFVPFSNTGVLFVINNDQLFKINAQIVTVSNN